MILYGGKDAAGRKGVRMTGTFIAGAGIALIAVSAMLFIASIVYRHTAGRRIKEELDKEYR